MMALVEFVLAVLGVLLLVASLVGAAFAASMLSYGIRFHKSRDVVDGCTTALVALTFFACGWALLGVGS